MSSSTLVVIGSGPGIGVATASLFASKKFNNIALIARRADQLGRDKSTILEAAASHGRRVQVRTWAVDISDTPTFRDVLSEVASFGDVSCVHFNAARVDLSTLLEFVEAEIVQDFMTTTVALHTTAIWAIPILQKQFDKPTILVTSSMLWKNPIPQLFSLSLSKAAQRNLVLSLQTSYPEVHIALLNVWDRVTPKSDYYSPERIAGKFWELYNQDKKQWTNEMDVNEF